MTPEFQQTVQNLNQTFQDAAFSKLSCPESNCAFCQAMRVDANQTAKEFAEENGLTEDLSGLILHDTS